jgi:hypothetical protein
MTQLVEDITIKITLNHCEGQSQVLGGSEDLRDAACDLYAHLNTLMEDRVLVDSWSPCAGVTITYTNTGLYEAPETGGGDN